MYLFFDDLSQTWGPDSTRGLLSPIRLGWAGFGFVDFLTHALYKRRKSIDIPSQEQDILELWELWSHQIYEHIMKLRERVIKEQCLQESKVWKNWFAFLRRGSNY